jgi:hypothetical protein
VTSDPCSNFVLLLAICILLHSSENTSKFCLLPWHLLWNNNSRNTSKKELPNGASVLFLFSYWRLFKRAGGRVSEVFRFITQPRFFRVSLVSLATAPGGGERMIWREQRGKRRKVVTKMCLMLHCHSNDDFPNSTISALNCTNWTWYKRPMSSF